MEHVGSVIDELKDAKALVTAQVEAGLQADVVITDLFNDALPRLKALACNMREQLALTGAINNGPWTSEQRQELAAALTKKGVGNADGKKNANVV